MKLDMPACSLVQMRNPPDLVLSPKVGKDALILRGDMDSLVRRAAIDGKVEPRPRSSHNLILPLLDYDHVVYELLEENLDLTSVMKGSVVIQLEILDHAGGNFWIRANGAFISAKYVLTVGHPFLLDAGNELRSITVFSGSGGKRTASIKEIPPEILNQIEDDAVLTTNTGLPVGFIDMVILELHESFRDDEFTIFKLPVSSSVLKAMEPIVLYGYPGEPEKIISSTLPRRLLPMSMYQDLITLYGKNDQQIDEIMIDAVKESFGNGEDPVFAFGATTAVSKPSITTYVTATYSTINGLSGAPIVCLRDPQTLIGINCGCFSHNPSAFFFATDSFFTAKVWQWLGVGI